MYFRCILLVSLMCSLLSTSAQDSTSTLNAEQVLAIVRKYHPVVRQAQINIEQSQANVLSARGAFDPILNTYISRKKFDGKEYYNSITPELEIPIWFGIEVYTGIQSLGGSKIDPTETIGQSNYFGMSIPLARDLLIDKRRAALRQASIFKNMAMTEQRAYINDLLMDAIDAYWTWVKCYQIYKVMKNNVAINEQRVALVRKSFINGERAAIDTIEALTQLQSFQVQQNQYYLDFQNAGLQLSAYLWKENNTPFDFTERIIPSDNWDNEAAIASFTIALTDLLSAADQSHPNVQAYAFKLDALNIEKKLKFQELLPRLDFRYNQLGKGYNIANTIASGPMFENSFQYGIKFQMPLSFSTARGNYKFTKLKIESTTLEQIQKRNLIQLKVKRYFNEFVNLKTQIQLQSTNYSYYQQLVKAEEIRLKNGESSLFLVNSRENKSFEALEKLIELKVKYYKNLYAMQWSAGLLL